jgi:hypothetical protein
MSLSLMGENCLVEHAASLFRGLISVLNEQAARSTSLTEELVSVTHYVLQLSRSFALPYPICDRPN